MLYDTDRDSLHHVTVGERGKSIFSVNVSTHKGFVGMKRTRVDLPFFRLELGLELLARLVVKLQ